MLKSERGILSWIFELISMLLVAAWGGHYLDTKFGTEPQILSALLLLVLLLEGYNFYKIYKQAIKEGKDSE